MIEKQNELNQRIENDTGLTQEDNSKKRKKRRKQQKKSQSQSQESEKLPEMNDEHKDSYSENRRNLPNKCKKRSFLRFSISLAGTVLKLLILLFFGVFLYVSFVNCKRDGGPLIPLSEPFCKDLHILFTKYQVSSSFWKNFQITATSAYSECRSIANNVWDNIQRGDYLKDAEELFYYVYGELSGAFFILQKYVNDAIENVRPWYNETFLGFMNDLSDNLIIASKMLIAVLSDIAGFIFERSLELFDSLKDVITYYVEHRSEMYDRLRLWWESMK